MVNKTGSSTGNLGFQSKYYDQESGLNYFYHRYYNPANGRFINEDPIGCNGGFNMYGFVNNNPVYFIDPFGLKCITTGALDYNLTPSIDISDPYFKLRLHITKLGIGGIEQKVTIKVAVKGNIICKRTCSDECSEQNKTWHIPFSHVFEKSFIIGTGLKYTNKYLLLLSSAQAVSRALSAYDIYSRYHEFIKSVLEYLQGQNKLLGIICQMLQ